MAGMDMKEAELRQLRAWAIDKALDKQVLEGEGREVDIATVISDARKLVSFVRSAMR